MEELEGPSFDFEEDGHGGSLLTVNTPFALDGLTKKMKVISLCWWAMYMRAPLV